MTQENNYYAPPAHDLSYENRNVLRKHSIFVGCCLLGYFGLQEIINAALILLGYADEFVLNPAFRYSTSALLFSIVAMGLPFFIYSLRKGRPSYIKAMPFHSSAPVGKLALVCIAGFGMCIVSNYIAGYSASFFEFVGVDESAAEQANSSTALDVLMNFICAAVVAPLAEEFVFRGVIMQPLRRYGEMFAVVASSFVFALAHVTPSNMVFAFCAGFVIGCAVVCTRSIWVGIIIHALNNGFSTFFIELEQSVPDIANVLYFISCIIVVAAGAVALIIYAVKYGMKMKENASGLGAGKRIKAFFFSVPMVLAILYFAFVSLINILV